MDHLTNCRQEGELGVQSVFNVSGNYFHPLLNSLVCFDPSRVCNQYAQPVYQNTSLASLLCDFIGTEDALVMNNFAEAANLVLSCLVYGREVVVWGGANEPYAFFSHLCSRLLDGGAKAVTRLPLADPEHLINEPGKTFITLSRHNQSILEQYYLTVSDGAQWQKDTANITVEWVEQASLVDLSSFGLPQSLWIQSHVEKGTDLIVFAGGGLIGGPPLGFVAGNKQLISRFKRMRAFAQTAPEPFTVQHFKQLIKIYQDGDALANVPVLAMMGAKAEEIKTRAMDLKDVLERSLGADFTFTVRAADTWFGDGDYSPVFPTSQVVIQSLQWDSKFIYKQLSQGMPVIIPGLTGDDELAIDLRTLSEQSDGKVTASLISTLQGLKKPVEGPGKYMDLLPQFVWVVDKDGGLVYISKPGAAFFNVAANFPKRLDDVLPPEIVETLLEAKNSVIASREQKRLDLKITGGSGDLTWLDVIISPIVPENGEISQVVSVATDITARKKTEEALKYMGMHDNLTSLYNRNYFEEEMKRLSSNRHFPISIVVCDIDGLKFINDTLGHEFGDRMIKATADILRKTFRTSDVVARIGGDEFAIILPQTDTKTAETIMERAEQSLLEFNEAQKGMPLNLSFGIANGEDDSQGIKDIFKKADNAMYNNKLAKRPLQKQQMVSTLLSLMSERSFLKEDQVGRLQQLTGLMGRYVGLSDDEISQILLLCQVYNIGKIALDDATFLKTGELSPSEWETVKRYPEVGYRITSALPGLDSVAEYILQHRERWDGNGYPQGLKGEDIHLFSRILSVVDAYHAMISPRPYREVLCQEDALMELKNNRGTQFDPRITDIYLSIMDQKIVNKTGA